MKEDVSEELDPYVYLEEIMGIVEEVRGLVPITARLLRLSFCISHEGC